MASYKVNVSLPQELVAEIDGAAAQMGMTRSGFIAEASARYVAEREAFAAEEQRKSDIDRAMANMRERGKKIPRDFDYVAAIRKDRERRRIW
jgi:metal-responsive CopG/Arc/MetJ family transcriptional regulator